MRIGRKSVTSVLCAVALSYGYTQLPDAPQQAAVSAFPHPWSAACRVSVDINRRFSNGGSGTLIGVTDDAALVLTVKHVAEQENLPATCQFGDQKVRGYVLAVSKTSDLAVLLVQRPKGIEPVPVAIAKPENGPYYMAGYPGYDRERLRYQKGEYVEHDNDTLTVTCRPEKGMSGGPTFDKYGRCVGAVSAYGVRHGYAGDGEALQALVEQYLK